MLKVKILIGLALAIAFLLTGGSLAAVAATAIAAGEAALPPVLVTLFGGALMGYMMGWRSK